MLEEFAKVVMEVIPEYVFANYENDEINNLNAVGKLREAAHSIYKIKEFELMRRYYMNGDLQAKQELDKSAYKNRGEFGELILHLLLRDFKGTIPLISKVYFKDTSGVPAHGFDTVHISPDEKVLWLGESKFYGNGKVGIRQLLVDLEQHFINIPKEEKIVVDIPFYEQNKDLITDEILVNIPEKDVKPQVRERYDKIYEISSELLDIIKKNGTSVNGQMSIYYALERDIQNGHYNDISWTRMPEYNKMLYILKLAENNTFTCENNKGILSVKQLTMYLNLYRANGNMMQIIESLYNYKKSKVKNLTAERDSNYYDQAIEEAFHIYRHWFQFTVPKAFRVVDSLQRYVCEKHGKKAGSYSYFVQQLENDFLQENLSILLEYGLPRSLVQKMTKFLPENLSEDEVLNYIIKNKSSIIKILTPYEQERLIACIL